VSPPILLLAGVGFRVLCYASLDNDYMFFRHPLLPLLLRHGYPPYMSRGIPGDPPPGEFSTPIRSSPKGVVPGDFPISRMTMAPAFRNFYKSSASDFFLEPYLFTPVPGYSLLSPYLLRLFFLRRYEDLCSAVPLRSPFSFF